MKCASKTKPYLQNTLSPLTLAGFLEAVADIEIPVEGMYWGRTLGWGGAGGGGDVASRNVIQAGV